MPKSDNGNKSLREISLGDKINGYKVYAIYTLSSGEYAIWLTIPYGRYLRFLTVNSIFEIIDTQLIQITRTKRLHILQTDQRLPYREIVTNNL